MEFVKKNPKIFLIAGKGRHGKDTTADFIRSYYEKKGLKTINLTNSYYLKDYAKRISDWNGEEETKPRTLLQELGTELIRNQIDEFFFIKRVLEDLAVFSYFYDIITISDVRMPYELELPKKNFSNVYTFHVVRPNVMELTETEQHHRTETALDDYHNYDFELQNDGTLEELKEKIETILERV